MCAHRPSRKGTLYPTGASRPKEQKELPKWYIRLHLRWVGKTPLDAGPAHNTFCFNSIIKLG